MSQTNKTLRKKLVSQKSTPVDFLYKNFFDANLTRFF